MRVDAGQAPALLAAPAKTSTWRPTEGEHVYVAGTGRWYTGHSFGAIVVDVRDADSTVKVHYADGGFKRFRLDDFRSLVRFKGDSPELRSEWGSASEEARSLQRLTSLHAELARSEERHEQKKRRAEDQLQESPLLPQIARLHKELALAQEQKDQTRHEELSTQLQALAAQRDAASELRVRLIDAVARGEFLRAHELQHKIKALEAGEQAGSLQGERFRHIAGHVAERSIESGLAGAGAMTLQVATLMWLRTTMNFQYRYGLGMVQAMRILYQDGGIPRFYRGLGPALLQGPLSRFGETAANAGVLAFFDETEARSWPAYVKTIFASSIAVTMRVALVPLDTLKTVLQVEGARGLQVLGSKYAMGGTRVFFHGAAASSAATFVGHYPWYTTFNTLNEVLPEYKERHKQLLRDAGIGFSASVVSDTVVNSLRVLKTVRQTREDTTSYYDIARRITKTDGLSELFGRGLQTRLLANGISGIVFSVLYKYFDQRLHHHA